ncbi:MAG TPA: hypothetical protein VJ602_02055 [Paludibacter sp.]|nr:hypothetical protein [Paludibacter sp.]
MLTNVSKDFYRKHFTEDPHPFITEAFIGLVEHKTDEIVRLIKPSDNVSLGLIAGVKNNILSSPFSAPFGGFHFINNEIFYNEVYEFLIDLKEFAVERKLQKLEITLPPDIYNSSINAKFINALVRLGFSMHTPDIVSNINLNHFNVTCISKRIVEKLKVAKRNNLSFIHAADEKMMMESYEVILNNRKMQDRQIYMDFSDLMNVSKIFPVDFFLVKDKDGENVGSAIFYRGHKKIVQAIFWGDIIPRRPLAIMDFLVINLFSYYKTMGFDYIDLALSSKDGIPNEGLVRFKETHCCASALRYTFSWSPLL